MLSKNWQKMSNIYKHQQTGFTLLEVMVALFIVAVTMGGAIKVMGGAATNTARMTDKTFANWVAMNQMVKLRLGGEWPSIGDTNGKEEMAGRNWNWVQNTIKTEDENIKRIEIQVWGENDDKKISPLINLVGFLAKP